MAELKLAPNEGIILQNIAIMSGSPWAAYTDELILTNLNIILIKRGMFGNKKNEQRFPITQIKKIDEKPQVMQGSNSLNGTPQLHIVFIHGVERFEFQEDNEKKIKKWIRAIYELFHCTPDNLPEDEEEIGFVTSTLKKGVNSIKNILGIKSLDVNNKDISIIKKIKCSGCRAPLIGKTGQIVKCAYCDTKNTF